MKRFALTLAVLVLLPLFTTASVLAAELSAPEKKAQEWVAKAIEFYKENGKEAALAAFNDKEGAFVDGDYYVIVCDLDGVFLAHGVNQGLVSKNLYDLKDVEGTYIIRDMIATGKAKGAEGGWTEYVWTRPETKKLQKKRTWVVMIDDLLFMTGVYVED